MPRYHYAIEKDMVMGYHEVIAKDFDEAVDVAVSHHISIEGEMLFGVYVSRDDLAEDIYCQFHDC